MCFYGPFHYLEIIYVATLVLPLNSRWSRWALRSLPSQTIPWFCESICKILFDTVIYPKCLEKKDQLQHLLLCVIMNLGLWWLKAFAFIQYELVNWQEIIWMFVLKSWHTGEKLLIHSSCCIHYHIKTSPSVTIWNDRSIMSEEKSIDRTGEEPKSILIYILLYWTGSQKRQYSDPGHWIPFPMGNMSNTAF